MFKRLIAYSSELLPGSRFPRDARPSHDVSSGDRARVILGRSSSPTHRHEARTNGGFGSCLVIRDPRSLGSARPLLVPGQCLLIPSPVRNRLDRFFPNGGSDRHGDGSCGLAGSPDLLRLGYPRLQNTHSVLWICEGVLAVVSHGVFRTA
jgi:hypothetical protein